MTCKDKFEILNFLNLQDFLLSWLQINTYQACVLGFFEAAAGEDSSHCLVLF